MERVDCVVIGAGCIGLAVARALALAGREVILLEQYETFGTQTSSRNSEVIHAGIYYQPGSLKAQLCVRGKALLYPYLSARGVDFKQCEKLIVATSEGEVAALAELKARAIENGVDDLTMISAAEAAKMEPGLFCHKALLSPSTGVFDSHHYMLALLGDFENAGGMVAFNSPFVSAVMAQDDNQVTIGGAEPFTLSARLLVNCAGHGASRVARAMTGFPAKTVPHTRPAKGRYFVYAGKAPFSRLIYPMPSNDSQGTHYTNDLGGQGRLGPDIVWGVDADDYTVEEDARHEFWQAARRYWPDLEEDRLHASYAGLRPKIAGPGEWTDFRIDGAAAHGAAGIIQLYGMESPGLTASLAIGEYVAGLAGRG